MWRIYCSQALNPNSFSSKLAWRTVGSISVDPWARAHKHPCNIFSHLKVCSNQVSAFLTFTIVALCLSFIWHVLRAMSWFSQRQWRPWNTAAGKYTIKNICLCVIAYFPAQGFKVKRDNPCLIFVRLSKGLWHHGNKSSSPKQPISGPYYPY